MLYWYYLCACGFNIYFIGAFVYFSTSTFGVMLGMDFEMSTSIFSDVTGDGLKTSLLGDCVKKCQQAFLAPLLGKVELLSKG
jgi:hypothetical protein